MIFCLVRLHQLAGIDIIDNSTSRLGQPKAIAFTT